MASKGKKSSDVLAVPGSDAPKPQLGRSPSMVERAVDTLKLMFNREDENVKVYQDLVLNATLFVGAIVLMHAYGHKLAV